MKIENLRIDEIRTDGGTQMREKLHEPTVAQYAELMKDGVEFPPAVVFFDGASYWLADGFHRVEARILLGRRMVRCEVRGGRLREAVIYAISANATHGLPRRRADKRRAVETLLKDSEWGKWSNGAIASRACVSMQFVKMVRRQMLDDGEIGPHETVLTIRNGKLRECRSTHRRAQNHTKPNYSRDYLKFLASFTAEQFERAKAMVSRREVVDRNAWIEAVECVMCEAKAEGRGA